MEEKRQELHKKAWDLLEKKGLKLGEKMMVRSAFIEWSGYKDAYPMIETQKEFELQDYYYSGYEEIGNILYKTQNEVILANAIYLNLKKFNANEFDELFKFTCRVIGLETNRD